MNKIDLGGRAAIVTGGARGIGYACAERLLASGAAVAIWDQDSAAIEQAIAALGKSGTVYGTVVDVTQETSVDAATKTADTRMGKIDILVNNAGITGPNKTSWEYEPAEWRRVIDVDLTGAFLCLRAVVPSMKARGYGRIVNMASVAGKEGNPNAPAYSASKAGVISLTKSLAKETANKDISVNCITPAAARTAIFDQMTQTHIDFMLSKIPRGRFVLVDEIAALAAFCASADCSFTTGAAFDISGGRATY